MGSTCEIQKLLDHLSDEPVTVIRSDYLRQSLFVRNTLKDRSYTHSRDQLCDLDRKTFSRAFIDQRQHLQPPIAASGPNFADAS